MHKGSAAGEWLLAYITSNDNIADMLTKLLNREKRKQFIGQNLHQVA